MYAYVLVYTCIYVHENIIFQFMLVHTTGSMYQYVQVCTCTYMGSQLMAHYVHTCIYQYIQLDICIWNPDHLA